MNKSNSQKGITLIALIITIVVLLILAVVAIRAVTGDKILEYATNARDDYQAAAEKENTTLQGYLDKIEANVPGNSQGENGGDDTEEVDKGPGLYQTDGTFISWETLITNGTLTLTDGAVTCNDISIEGKLVVDESVTVISDAAFVSIDYDTLSVESCINLREIVIPNSVTSIGRMAFSGSSLESIVIPDSVTSIAGDVFNGCMLLEKMVVDTNNKVYNSGNNANCIIETGTNTLISGCKNTIIPDSIVAIGEYAFAASNVTSIIIPDSVKTIGELAFNNCDNLVSVTIGNSVEVIGSDLFNNCKKLTNLTIGNSVKTIEHSAFAWCTSLISVTIPNSVEIISLDSFAECGNLTTIYYNGTAEGAPWGATNAKVQTY